MEDKELFEKLENIIRDSLEIPQDKKITLDMKLKEDLGMDEFGYYEIIYWIEEELGIYIKKEDESEAKTVKDLMNYLKK